MSKERQKRNAGEGGMEGMGDGTRGSECPVIVVGIGALSGGLNSLKQLFSQMPSGHGAAFVVIQPPEPAQENLTVNLLREQTRLAVVEAADGMPVVPDRIHLMPPDKFLNIVGCRLTLQEPVYCNGLRMPIDHFFCSLAADQRRRACGIVLSGAGSDGTLGLSEIKAAGGRTLMEDPGKAGFPGMPQSAIDTGVVDAILPAEAMGGVILALAEKVSADTRSEPVESPEFDAHLRAVLDILRAKVGHDFRCYKPNTLVRRIHRRMTLGKIATFVDYARYLHEHPEEVGLLQKDLLIGVTEFFRQSQAWQFLAEKVIAALVESARPESGIRVWVPGCSTGQEAYSLAMLLAEQLEKSDKKVGIQIFATDSDAAALATARSGSYSGEEIGENVSPERRKRFFARKEGRYQVVREVRDKVVFAPQNLAADPPFSRLDLISCRNLLIYLNQEVQKKVIALFHFALREGGFLFLGTAETIGDRKDLFEPVSKKWRIYRRIGAGRPAGVEIPICPGGGPIPTAGRVPLGLSTPRMSLSSAAQQVLLDRFSPASVLIDRKLQVLYVHGAVEDYLTFPPGELTTQVVDMAREGLRARLRGAVGQCLEDNRSVSITARVRRGKKSVPVKATVSPLRYPRETDGLLLITFEDYRVPAAGSGRTAKGESDLHQLEDELKITREELQSTIEQLESSNDQLKASNEEVTAANEELQSANEELETSKEELQSLNEELNTINARLQEKVEELENTNNDVLNLLSSTNIATVFLDKELKVRRYTPASTRLFSLIPSDVGRPLGDVLRRFTDEALLDDARRVLADLTPLSQEVQAEDGRWYIRRITPYRTQDDRIEGVVITFVDVCDLKATEEVLRLRQAELETARAEAENGKRRLEAVMEALPVGVAITDARGGKIQSNSAFEGVWGGPVPPADSISDYAAFQARWTDTGKAVAPEEWASARAVQKGESVVGQLLEIQRFDGSRAYVINNAAPIRDAAGQVIGSAVAIQDLSDLRKAEEALREAHERAEWLARFPEENPNPVLRVSAQGYVLYRNPASAKLPNWVCEVGQPLPPPLLLLVPQAMNKGEETQQDVELGGRLYSVSITPFSAEGYANVYGRDITEHRQAEQAVFRAKKEWERTFDAVPDLIAILDDRHRILRVNRAMAQRLGLTPAQLVGKICHQAVHGLECPPDFCPHSLTLADGREHVAEVHEDFLGGDFLVSTTPLADKQGRRIGSVHVARDITRRKQAEEALRESEQRLNRAQEIAHLGSWELDLVNNRLSWSDEVYRIFGLQPQEFGATYEAFLEAVHPDDRAAVDAAYSGSLREGRDTYEIEHRVIRKTTGEIGIVRERCEHIRDGSGRIIRSVGMVHDITASKGTEEALRQRTLELQQLNQRLEDRVQERTAELAKSNEMLQAEIGERLRLVAAVEQAGEGIVITDPEGVIQYVNPAFEQICEYGQRSPLGKLYFEILAGDGPEEGLKKKIQGVIASGEAWSGHVIRKGRDGQSCELDITFSPVRDPSGRITNYLAVERDVTQEVRLEQHMRQMQKVEALGTLAGGIAHDFNNLLNPIFINTELVLLDAPLDDRMRQYLQTVLQAAERGRNLVKQIVTFSRQKEQERKPLKAEPLIKEALKFLRASLPTTLEIRENIQGERGYILADPTQINQVVMNLCGNAAYAMGEKGGVLEVSLAEVEVEADMALSHPDLNPGPYLRLTVADTGVGMTREVMDRAFDPFFTTKKPGKGSGMGLSVVHGIVRNHGGAITVHSEPGKGSTFDIFFPRMEEAAASVGDASEGTIVPGRERILLVDDEEVQVEGLRNMLERLGYKVVAKTDSLEALALFRMDPRLFDLVITDQTMPQMTGVKLAVEVLHIRPDIPVILCTGFSEMIEADGARALGIQQFLMKPYSVREMAETIRRALEKKAPEERK